MNCGRISVEGMFCTFCHSPLFEGGSSNPLMNVKEGVYLGDVEGRSSLFLLPINPYFGHHFAFYGVTGTGKTRAAMNLAINAENEGLCLRVLDIESEWKKIIPRLRKKTIYYDSELNLKVNPFDLNDPGLTLLILKETIFMGMEREYGELSPQMNYVLSKCVLQSKGIPDLIDRIIFFEPKVPFKFQNLDSTKTDPRDVEIIAGMLGSIHVDEVSYFSNLLTNLERRRAIVKTPEVKQILKNVEKLLSDSELNAEEMFKWLEKNPELYEGIFERLKEAREGDNPHEIDHIPKDAEVSSKADGREISENKTENLEGVEKSEEGNKVDVIEDTEAREELIEE